MASGFGAISSDGVNGSWLQEIQGMLNDRKLLMKLFGPSKLFNLEVEQGHAAGGGFLFNSSWFIHPYLIHNNSTDLKQSHCHNNENGSYDAANVYNLNA